MDTLYIDQFDYLGLIVLMPLIGAIINGLLGSKLPRAVTATVACGAMLLSFIFSLISVRGLLANAYELGGQQLYGELTYTAYRWIYSGALELDIAFLLDPLSAMMILIITGVGFLIHLYSVGYMSHDPGQWRYFAYLNLFVFSMLLLVLGKNMLVTFIGWEGVGVCSYLLIGFWYTDDAKAMAGQKAFIVNRVGDFAFLAAIFILFYEAGTLDYLELERMSTSMASAFVMTSVVPTVPLLLFVACTGKSAQIPLYTWLPDAMAGPTPVSALIHAATMVTAGVFLIARTNWLFSLSFHAMWVVAVVGILTAFFAATIALVQNDIKKVLAYSTISQLGYMFAALGVGAFTAAIFHLMTHAFFKALLFLGSGSVIHAMSDEQDIRKMGGLKRWMPVTRWTFLFGCLAIAGIPLFSGFYSKDAILWGALSNTHLLNVAGVGGESGTNIRYLINEVAPTITAANGAALDVATGQEAVSWLVFILGVLTAGMTAFYMFRLYFLTFEGECRAPEEIKAHIHESPLAMTIPLMVLALLSIIGGYTGWPHFLVPAEGTAHDVMLFFEHWHRETFAVSNEFRLFNRFGEHPYAWEIFSAAAGFVAALTGIGLAYLFYLKDPDRPKRIAESVRGLYRVLQNKYYVDEAYDTVFVKGSINSGRGLWRFDRSVIDGLLVDGAGFLMSSGGRILRHLQSGQVQRYATYFVLALVLAMVAVLLEPWRW